MAAHPTTKPTLKTRLGKLAKRIFGRGGTSSEVRLDAVEESLTGIAPSEPQHQSSAGPSPSAQSEPGEPSSGGHAKKVFDGLVTVLRILERSADAFPPLKSTVGGLIACVDLMQSVKGNREDYEELAGDLSTMAEGLAPHLSNLVTGDVSGSFARIVESISEEVNQIRHQQERTTSNRIVEAKEDKEDVVRRYRRISTLFHRLQSDVGLRTWETTQRLRQTSLLELLSPIEDARFNSSYSMTIRRRGCTARTREQILRDLVRWAKDPQGARVYWLSGMAGTGKTTILYSLCELLVAQRQLGANYFCSRISPQCRDVNTIVTTLAYQLSQYSPTFRSELRKTLEKEPETSKLQISCQLEKLIQAPLDLVKDSLPEDTIIVIDALDECEDSFITDILLQQLLRNADSSPLKFLITSRPEPIIRDKMLASEYSPSILRLHDVEENIVKADIEIYLNEALVTMSPLPVQVKKLVERAGRLFIYAATAVRYIAPDNPRVDSAQRLQHILQRDPTAIKQHEELDRLYRRILMAACDEDQLEDNEIEVVQLTVRTVLCAQEPIPVHTLASLLGRKDKQVGYALEPLHSVLHVQEGASGLVAPFHASFPDFIFDQHRSGTFYCNKKAHNGILSQGCFHIMKTQLRFNICKLESSFVFDKDVVDLQDRINQYIPVALSYASRFWGDHLRESSVSDTLHFELIDFLANRFLFWMEALNIECNISTGVGTLQQALNWLETSEDLVDTMKQVVDAVAFVARFAGGACRQSTPHIYISLLSFCQRDSFVFKNYRARMQGLIEMEGSLMETWESGEICVWQMECQVEAIAFSPDGHRVSCGLKDSTIRILDAHSGNTIVKPWPVLTSSEDIPGSSHHNRLKISSLFFSSDGKRLASGLSDGTIRIWDSANGSTILVLDVGTAAVASVAFSPNDTRIVCGSDDGTIQLWDALTGEVLVKEGSFSGHSKSVTCISFSPDGERIISGSDDGCVRIWDASQGVPAGPEVLEHDRGLWVEAFSDVDTSVLCTTYSQDDTRIAAIFDGGVVRFWNALSGGLVTEIDGEDGVTASAGCFSRDVSLYACASTSQDLTIRESIHGTRVAGPFRATTKHIAETPSIAFSRDGRRIIVSADSMIRIWDVKSGQGVSSITEDGPIEAVAFSPSGHRIVEGDRDGSVRVWDVQSGEKSTGLFKGHEGSVRSIAFIDDNLFATGSDDATIRLWDARSGESVKKPFEGHSSGVGALAISPDRCRIASSSWNKTIRIWDPSRGKEVGKLKAQEKGIAALSFSPDGQQIISASTGMDRTLRVWDASNFKEFDPDVTCSDLSLNGARSSDRIHIWDAEGRPRFRGIDIVAGKKVALCRDGRRIAVVSEYSSLLCISILDSCSGEPMAVLRGGTSMINSIAVSPDGCHILAGTSDGTSRIYKVPLGPHPSSSFSPRAKEVPDNILEDALILEEENGWVSANGRPFFWVPPSFRPYLPFPPFNTRVFCSLGFVSADYSNLAIGESWTNCNLSL